MGAALSRRRVGFRCFRSPRTTLYDYDEQGQLIQDGSTDYSYDANGNRDGYTYDSTYTNQLAGDGVWTYSYDGEGNVTDKISVSLDVHWHYSYDHANQLTEARKYDYETSGPEDLLLEADYVYDVYGGRIAKIVDLDGSGGGSAVATRFALDGWNNTKASPVGNENWDVWADLDGSSSLTTRYFRGDRVDQIDGRIESGSPYWYLTDHLGSVRDVIAGSSVHSIDYDAFGNLLQDDASRGRYGWTGREYDAEIGLQYNRARYYDAATGRWISQDPLSFDAGDGNLYRYVKNKAVGSIDPSGLQAASPFRQGKLLTFPNIQSLEGENEAVGSYYAYKSDKTDDIFGADVLVVTAKLGIVDTGHLRHNMEMVKYFYEQLKAGKNTKGSLLEFPMTLGPRARFRLKEDAAAGTFLSIAQSMAWDTDLNYEAYSYGDPTPGYKNSAFSPEDLPSDLLGILLAAKGITNNGGMVPNEANWGILMDDLMNKTLKEAGAVRRTEARAAFNDLVNDRWVERKEEKNAFNNLLDANVTLLRRNFDYLPWLLRHKALNTIETAPSVPNWFTVPPLQRTIYITEKSKAGGYEAVDIDAYVASVRRRAIMDFGADHVKQPNQSP